MKRREFISLLGGAAATPLIRPHLAIAQQGTPVVGVLYGGPRVPTGEPQDVAMRKGLNEQGYAEGRNVVIEYRATEQPERLPALAVELVRRQVTVIAARSTVNTAQAAMAATTTIPIVFTNGIDPVRFGLVASLNRPGGNVTGVTFYAGALMPKQLELLRELVPGVARIGFLANPENLISDGLTTDVQAAARSIGQELVILNARNSDEIDAAFASAAQQGVGALLVAVDGLLFTSRRAQFAVLAARHRIPAIYGNRNFVPAGGLMSYTDDRLESGRLAGMYIGRILKGEKPADLPVLQPTKFEFVINLRTAKALGITFPQSFHLRADEVIE
jgi:putative ABC transport system substrate-binding protein